MKKKNKYGIFIIESLRADDIFFDGQNLGDILELSEISHKYREVLSKDDFIQAIEEFQKSKLRYLHISCHADMDGLEINGDEISNSELSKILKSKMTGKRLFLSACKGSNRNMATAVIAKCQAQSVIGPPVNLYFEQAAIFWPAFYYALNIADSKKMNKKMLSDIIKKCVDLFQVDINYYHKIEKEPNYLRRFKFRHYQSTMNNRIKISAGI